MGGEGRGREGEGRGREGEGRGGEGEGRGGEGGGEGEGRGRGGGGRGEGKHVSSPPLLRHTRLPCCRVHCVPPPVGCGLCF